MKHYLHSLARLLLLTSVLAAMGNATIFALYLLDNHWAEEYGLYCGIIFTAVVAVCLPSAWKCCKGLAVAAVVLSTPMVQFWLKWMFRLIAYLVRGNT